MNKNSSRKKDSITIQLDAQNAEKQEKLKETIETLTDSEFQVIRFLSYDLFIVFRIPPVRPVVLESF
ncbi:hypothetical protein CNEO3_980001 [Clostridium neonatale]|nr:hypothetical protein CNEO3_980001 [Clostridium neonatale]